MYDQSSSPKKTRSNRGLGVMSTLAAEMRRIVIDAAGPSKGVTIKGQMRAAWQALGRPPFWRLRAAWYGEAGRWSGEAIEDFRRRHRRRLGKEANARGEADKAIAVLRSLRDSYAAIDPDFYRDQILAIERTLGDARGPEG